MALIDRQFCHKNHGADQQHMDGKCCMCLHEDDLARTAIKKAKLEHFMKLDSEQQIMHLYLLITKTTD